MEKLHQYMQGPVSSGTTPLIQQCAQNLDFSLFPLLCERTYVAMQRSHPLLHEEMPFSAFLHYCNIILHVNIADIIQDKLIDRNGFLELKFKLCSSYIPKPIAEYISAINKMTTGTDVNVAINIPRVALPLDLTGSIAGSFGSVNADNHNLYECYVAPQVTRRRIEATLKRDYKWTPLYSRLLPPGLVATENFLGYGEIDVLNNDGYNFLKSLNFKTSNNSFLIRLQYSHELVDKCSSFLYSSRIDSCPALVKKIHHSGLVGFLEVTSAWPSNESIAKCSAHIWSPQKLEISMANMMYLYGLKRKRNNNAPGLCMLKKDGNNPDGWLASINRNFEMVAPFHSKKLPDYAELRTPYFQAITPNGSSIFHLDEYISASLKQ